MLHNVGAANSLLTLHQRYGDEWFPVTTGYLIVRSLFETDVNAHYITMDRPARARRYIEFGYVVRKNMFEAVARHLGSQKPSWREALQLMYEQELAPKKGQIDANYDGVRSKFENVKGKRSSNWAGKSIREMAKEVDHLEAYDIFYAELSSFAHGDVEFANRFLKIRPDGPLWTQSASDYDVGSVFRYAAIFLDCFLELFGKEFGLWDSAEVLKCWDLPEAKTV